MVDVAELTDAELGLLHLQQSLETHSYTCLRILGKAGGANVPFVWNKAQRYIHER